MSITKIDSWIRVGYKVLGNEGMEGMKIERLAKSLKLNKSGFYYYFGSMNAFVRRLLEYHISAARMISQEIAICDNVDPDLLLVVVKHKEFFLVESSLLVRPRTITVDSSFSEASDVINKAMLPLVRKASGMSGDQNAALAYVNIIKHFLYSRIDQNHFDFEHLHVLMAETREVLNKVVYERRGEHA